MAVDASICGFKPEHSTHISDYAALDPAILIIAVASALR
jgi:hypothetical protein